MNATPLSPDDPAELGGFTLLGRIGHGGMGQVYLGESAAGEAVAVKVIKPTVVDSETRQRFAQEIEVLKTVWGPRVAAFVKAEGRASRAHSRRTSCRRKTSAGAAAAVYHQQADNLLDVPHAWISYIA